MLSWLVPRAGHRNGPGGTCARYRCTQPGSTFYSLWDGGKVVGRPRGQLIVKNHQHYTRRHKTHRRIDTAAKRLREGRWLSFKSTAVSIFRVVWEYCLHETRMGCYGRESTQGQNGGLMLLKNKQWAENPGVGFSQNPMQQQRNRECMTRKGKSSGGYVYYAGISISPKRTSRRKNRTKLNTHSKQL